MDARLTSRLLIEYLDVRGRFDKVESVESKIKTASNERNPVGNCRGGFHGLLAQVPYLEEEPCGDKIEDKRYREGKN